MTDSDKRKVSTDALETLGTIIDDNEKRDAIHLAVIPVEAKQKLLPGQDVGPDGTGENPVGIVDPFLKYPVFPGQFFWLVIYPRQITSLRHVWTHPEFPEKKIIYDDSKGKIYGHADLDKLQESKKWITEWISQYGFTYEEAMSRAKDFLENDECWQGYDDNNENYGLFDGESVPKEFWEHYQNITGEVIPEDKKNNFFSCWC